MWQFFFDAHVARKEWNEHDHPRGITDPQKTNRGSFAPKKDTERVTQSDDYKSLWRGGIFRNPEEISVVESYGKYWVSPDGRTFSLFGAHGDTFRMDYDAYANGWSRLVTQGDEFYADAQEDTGATFALSDLIRRSPEFDVYTIEIMDSRGTVIDSITMYSRDSILEWLDST